MDEVEVAEEAFDASASAGDEPPVASGFGVGIRGSTVSPVPSVSAAEDDDYGIVAWEHDPVGEEEEDDGGGVDVAVTLGEGWERKAQNELHEKAEWRQRDIQELRNMVQGKCACVSNQCLPCMLYEVHNFLNEPCRLSSFVKSVAPISCHIWIQQAILHYIDIKEACWYLIGLRNGQETNIGMKVVFLVKILKQNVSYIVKTQADALKHPKLHGVAIKEEIRPFGQV